MNFVTVEASTAIFGKVLNIRVPDSALIDEQLASNPTAPFGPYAASTANTDELITTRYAIFVPPKFASVC